MYLKVKSVGLRWGWCLYGTNHKLLSQGVRTFKTKSAAIRSANAVQDQAIFDEMWIEGQERDGGMKSGYH